MHPSGTTHINDSRSAFVLSTPCASPWRRVASQTPLCPRICSSPQLAPCVLRATATADSPTPKSIKNLKIDPVTGNPSTASSTQAAVEITLGSVALPLGELPALYTSSSHDIVSKRKAEAAVFVLAKTLEARPSTWMLDAPVVVFGHGFSQLPRNYASLLRRLAAEGYVVLAPRVWLFGVVWPWVSVETTSWCACPGPKLQTALLLDVARSSRLAVECGAKRVHLLGHSMGGAMGLAYLRFVADVPAVTSACLMAPAVASCSETKLNPLVVLGRGADGDAKLREFAKQLPEVPLLLLQGTNDSIVPERDTARVFEAVRGRDGGGGEAGKGTLVTGCGEIVNGTHLGYEDRLDVQFGFWWGLDKLVFLIVDAIVYGQWDVFRLDTAEQLETVKEVVVAWLGVAGTEEGEDVVRKVNAAKGESVVRYLWSL